MISIAYKVVYRTRDDTLESCCRRYEFPPQFRVTYQPGVAVGPALPGTKLFVFETRHAAWMFSRKTMRNTRVEIWSCEVTNLKPIKYIGNPAKVPDFWYAMDLLGPDDEDGLRREVSSIGAPEGTCWCDTVKLLKLLEVT